MFEEIYNYIIKNNLKIVFGDKDSKFGAIYIYNDKGFYYTNIPVNVYNLLHCEIPKRNIGSFDELFELIY